MINFLSDFYEQDRSSLIKYSLRELYEDLIDKQMINEFETKEKNEEVKFVDSKEIINSMTPKKPALNKR